MPIMSQFSPRTKSEYSTQKQQNSTLKEKWSSRDGDATKQVSGEYHYEKTGAIRTQKQHY